MSLKKIETIVKQLAYENAEHWRTINEQGKTPTIGEIARTRVIAKILFNIASEYAQYAETHTPERELGRRKNNACVCEMWKGFERMLRHFLRSRRRKRKLCSSLRRLRGGNGEWGQ